MSEQLTLIEEVFGLTVVEGENLQLTLDGGNGPAGPAGAAGVAGPNTVTTSTSTTLNGYIFGNGTTIAGATAAASAATPSTLVVRTSGGAASFTGITNNGALTLSTGTTFTYGAGIAAAHRTALGLGSLATQSGTFSGTHSGDSSGTNTGDQDLSNFLSRRTILEVNGTDAPISQSLVEQGYLSNGRRVWANGDGGTLLYDGASWFLTQLDPDSLVVYDAFKTSGSYEPWLLTGWTVSTGSGEPTFVLDPAEPLGNGVIVALDLPADTNGGFLTAGTGGTLPITRGGTGATTAGLARTALGSGATGDQLFTAETPAAARETALNEILKYDPNAAATRTNPAAQAADDVLTNINLTAGIWEIHFYFSFNVLSGGVLPNLLFGTPASVDLANTFIPGNYHVANQALQVLSLNTTTGVMALQAGANQTNRQYVGSLTVNITGNTSFGMTFARSTDVALSTIIRRAGAFLRARKING